MFSDWVFGDYCDEFCDCLCKVIDKCLKFKGVVMVEESVDEVLVENVFINVVDFMVLFKKSLDINKCMLVKKVVLKVMKKCVFVKVVKKVLVKCSVVKSKKISGSKLCKIG